MNIRRKKNVWYECVDYKIRHTFGECDKTQNRNNENTQEKRPRITDRIKKELFPSWQKSSPFPFNKDCNISGSRSVT
jgi:hypothetical protein